MNDEELRSTIEQVKAQVKAKPENAEKSEDEVDEMILDEFFKSYTEGKMSKEDLGAIADAMGYEFTEEFDNDPNAQENFEPGDADEALKPEGEAPAAAPETTEEKLEDVKAIEPGESVDEFKEKLDDIKSPAPENPAETPSEGGEDDEDEERKKASELWKIDLTNKKD